MGAQSTGGHSSTEPVLPVRPAQGEEAHILKMPVEIIHNIADELPTARDKCSLCRTSRDLNFIVRDKLYRHGGIRVANDILKFAAKRGFVSVANRALAYGAEIDAATGHDYETALMIACRSKKMNMIEYLVNHGANINNSGSRDGGTPLLLSAWSQDIEAVKYLIAKGADGNVRNRYGETALHLAVKKDNLPLVEHILKTTAVDVNSTCVGGFTPLLSALRARNMPIARMLLDRGANPTYSIAHGDWVFGPALRSDDADTMKEVLDLGISPHITDGNMRTPLSLVAEKGCPRKMRLLIEHGADVDAVDPNGKSPLMHAAFCEATHAMEELLTHGARLDITDTDGLTASHLAACDGKLLSMNVLLNHNAHVDIEDKHGHTPLYRAAELQYRSEPINLLLNRGGSLHALTPGDDTPLMVASRTANTICVATLLEGGADPNAQDSNGVSALAHALRAAEQLQEVRAGPRLPVSFPPSITPGNQFLPAPSAPLRGEQFRWAERLTVGDMAALYGKKQDKRPQTVFTPWEETVKLLVSAGADPYLPDQEWVTPMAIAFRMTGRVWVDELLVGRRSGSRKRRNSTP